MMPQIGSLRMCLFWVPDVGTSQYLAPILPLMAGIVDAAIPTGSSKPEVWLARWVSSGQRRPPGRSPSLPPGLRVYCNFRVGGASPSTISNSASWTCACRRQQAPAVQRVKNEQRVAQQIVPGSLSTAMLILAARFASALRPRTADLP
jgi:hypothetical protein